MSNLQNNNIFLPSTFPQLLCVSERSRDFPTTSRQFDPTTE